MKNILNTKSISQAQERLNKALQKLENKLAQKNTANNSNSGNKKLQEKLEKTEKEFKQYKAENEKERKEIKKNVDEAIKQLEDVLNGNS